MTGLLLAATAQTWAMAVHPVNLEFFGGRDFAIYRSAAEQWLAGGSWYLPHQVAGPYALQDGDVLYPPLLLLLLIPFTILPAALWWIVPLGVTVWAVASLRPAVTVWPVLALCLWWPPTTVKILTGNPVIWALAALALGALYAWPSVFVLLKPTLAPFALFGVRHRSWWLALGTTALISLLFLPLWSEYVRVLLYARHDKGWLYSIQEVPTLLIPVVAWMAAGAPSGKARRSSDLRSYLSSGSRGG